MTTYYRVTVPVKGSDGKTRFRPVGAMFPQRDGAKSAFKVMLDFPVGATEFVLFAPGDNEGDDDNITE